MPKFMKKSWCDRDKGYNPSLGGSMRNIPPTVITQSIRMLMALSFSSRVIK